MKIIIGGSGYIGSELLKYFSEKGEEVLGTYYKNPKGGLRFFDLKNPDLKKLGIDLNEIKEVIIASGMSKISECKSQEAYEINVDGTKKLIEQCFELDIKLIFLSSDCVFNGKKGNYNELDETDPINDYGVQKKIIEDFLLKSKRPFLIARLSKVFGLVPGDNTLLTSWAKDLINNEKINCAVDQIICPIYIKDLINILTIAINKNLTGLYNIASPECFNRYELAVKLQQELGISSGEIIKCEIKDLNLSYSLPLNMSLDVRKIREDTGFEFTKMEDCLKELKETMNL